MKCNMDIAIFGMTFDKAQVKMIEVVEKSGETIIKRTRDAILTDKNRYRCYTANESTRGLRFHECYVDWDISLGVFQMVIKPCLREPRDKTTGEYLFNRDVYNSRNFIHFY